MAASCWGDDITYLITGDQQSFITAFLLQLSQDKLAYFKTQLHALSPCRLTRLTKKLAKVPDACLESYLNFLVSIPESYQIAKQPDLSVNLEPTNFPSIPYDHISRLPTELQLMILDQLFQAVFIPGEMVPFWYINHINDDCFVDSNEAFWYKYALRALDSKLYERYKDRYWTDNTWVSQSLDPIPCFY